MTAPIVISRKAARAAGLTRYFTGTACQSGHIAERKVSDCHCVQCANAARRRRHGLDPESHSKAVGEWQAQHKDAVSARKRRWYGANKAAVIARHAVWREQNRDAYRAANRNRRARKKSASGSHAPADISAIRTAQRDRCAVCRANLRGHGEVDHIVPLAGGGSNFRANLQLLCKSCNASKGAKEQAVFMRSRGRFL